MYENDGAQSFTARVISDDSENVKAVAIADMTGNGVYDIITATEVIRVCSQTLLHRRYKQI